MSTSPSTVSPESFHQGDAVKFALVAAAIAVTAGLATIGDASSIGWRVATLVSCALTAGFTAYTERKNPYSWRVGLWYVLLLLSTVAAGALLYTFTGRINGITACLVLSAVTGGIVKRCTSAPATEPANAPGVQ